MTRSQNVFVSFVLLSLTIPAAAQEPKDDLSPELAKRLGLMLDRDWHERPQWADMLSALLQGRGFDPGEGWFGPSESRYNWDSFADQFDADENGRVTAEELPETERRSFYLARLDRTRDGELSRDDFFTPTPGRVSQLAGELFSRWDGDSNGRVSQSEFADFFAAADPEGLAFFTPEDLEAALAQPPKRASAESDVPTEAAEPWNPSTSGLLNAFLAGELGSLQPGPKLNDEAPGFRLATFDGKTKISLSDYRDKKPVVLIFGSFT